MTLITVCYSHTPTSPPEGNEGGYRRQQIWSCRASVRGIVSRHVACFMCKAVVVRLDKIQDNKKYLRTILLRKYDAVHPVSTVFPLQG
jgi:hypothetical protein